MTQNSSLRNEAICKHLNYSLHPSIFLEQGLGLNKRKISVRVKNGKIKRQGLTFHFDAFNFDLS